MKHPSDDVLKVIDQLAKRKLSQIENPNYLYINVLLYTAAVTTKEYLNDLKENCTEKSPKVKVFTMDNKHRSENITVKKNNRPFDNHY